MAKDDYFVIVYKILSYLYVKLKSGEDTNPNMITHYCRSTGNTGIIS